MTHATAVKEEPVRLLFEMTREDNPRLYDDLVRFNKGTKRVNRLRFLAHEGLLAQHWNLMPVMPAVHTVVPPRVQTPASVSPTSALHTNQAFSMPAGADEER
jgi:hypothetical protein